MIPVDEDGSAVNIEPNFPRAAYIHVPFCRHRCGYCDFTLVAGRDDLIDRYLAALQLEIDQSFTTSLRAPLDTLFFGGGTPTHLSNDQLQRLMEIVQKRYFCASDCEISVEANPLDLTEDKISLLADLGVNRVSLGVQSLESAVLSLLERDHQPEDVRRVIERLRRWIANISVDLIFGVPGQTLVSWRDTLQQAVSLEPTHISTYGLTWEDGTAFTTRRRRGELRPIEENLERDQYAAAIDQLTAAGYEHYEISNFARPGFRCRHNQVYWRGEEFCAYGPGAARYVAGRRETNVRSVLGWLDAVESGRSPVAEAEQLDSHHRARELIYLGLRTRDGINQEDFFRCTGLILSEFAETAIRKTVAAGWLEVTEASMRLTREGLFVADRVAAEFL
jgi:oxygen-independent coproporphyrinogen-3 oxidase